MCECARLRLGSLPSFYSSIHSFIKFILFSLCFDHKISARLHDGMTDTRRSILQPTKSSFDLTFYNCAHEKCARNSLIFSTVSFWTFSFISTAASFRFNRLFKLVNNRLRFSYCFFGLKEKCLLQNLADLMSNIIRFDFAFYQHFAGAFNLLIFFIVSLLVPQIDGFIKESLNQHDEQLLISFIHSYVLPYHWKS